MARLLGSNIMLREYQKEDFEEIRKWVNDSETVVNLDKEFVFPHTEKVTESFLNERLEDNNPNYKGFVIADMKTEEYIGQIDLMDIDWINRTATLGIIIGSKKNRGKGIGTEAIKLLQEFAFNRLNLHRLELALRDYNLNGYHCYVKCGFKEEGRKRQNLFILGRYTDTILMSILKKEYLEKRAYKV